MLTHIRKSFLAIILFSMFSAITGCMGDSENHRYVYTKFNGNGGRTLSGMDFFDVQVEEDARWSLPEATFLKEGYTLVAWRKDDEFRMTSTYKVPGEPHIGTSREVWNATWLPNLSFDANGGQGTMATQTASIIAANAYTRSGYTFTGWNTKADGTGTAYADKASINITAPTTLYARWHAGAVPADPPVTPPITPPANPAAVYHLDNNLVESSPHNRTALKAGSASLFATSGKLNQGVTGPSTSDFIYFPGNYSLAGDYSVAMWVKTTATGGWLIAKQGTAGSDGHGYRYELKLTIMPSGKVAAELGSATPWAMTTLLSDQVVNDGNWHFVCLVVQGASLSLYVDKNAASSAAVAVPRLPSSTAAIILGGNANSTSASPTALSATGLFVGTIDEIHIYDKALSAADVATLQ